MLFVVLLCLGASVGLGAPPASAESKPRVVITDAQVSNWVRVWQKRLRLDDWKIEARIVRASELKPDTLGNLKWNSVSRTATIKVLSPLDYDAATGDIAEDIEYTVVHELLHLQLAVLPRDMNRKDIEEQVVNRLADALMQLDKGDSFRARSTPSTAPPGRTDASAPDVARQTRPPVETSPRLAR
jgi:hypothetical protein